MITRFLLAAILAIVFLSPVTVNAQGKNSPEYIRELNVYKKAKFFNDPLIARQAIYNMIELDPADNSLLDSLAYEYYSFRQYASSLLVTLEALKRDPNNLPMLELKAICWEQLGDLNKALEGFEALFLKNNSSLTLYKIGFIQLELKRFTEATTSADILLGKEDVDDIQMNFPKGESSQQVSLKAAAYNLKGLISQSQGNTDDARKNFNEALKIVPDFELVQKNIDELEG